MARIAFRRFPSRMCRYIIVLVGLQNYPHSMHVYNLLPFILCRMLHNITRILPSSLRICNRKALQQCYSKLLPLNRSHISNTICTLTIPGYFYLKHDGHLLICQRNNSDDSTSDSRNVDGDSKNKSSKDSASDLVDFDEMLENIRKLRTEGDGDIKNIYTGKKKYRISDEERRTQPITIEELVDFLTLLNGIDICVIHVDPNLNYVTYLVTVTGVSTRHLLSMAKSLVYEVKCIDVGYILFVNYTYSVNAYPL